MAKTDACTGKYGLGYYLDKPPVVGPKPEPKQPAPAAKPKAIGLNSIVKGLAPKGGGIGKKKKSGRKDSDMCLACVGLLVPMFGCCCWQLALYALSNGVRLDVRGSAVHT